MNPSARPLVRRRPHLATARRPVLLAACLGVVVSLLLGACGRGAPASTATIPGQSAPGATATVTHVVDGDTVDLSFASGGVERARLLGVDTPETVKPDTPVQCFGPEASAHTKELLTPGTRVLVQRDAEARDRYGRLLVYVWRQDDGLFVNESIVADGYARTLSIAPNTTHRAGLAAAASHATSAHLGLWGACATPPSAGGPGR